VEAVPPRGTVGKPCGHRGARRNFGGAPDVIVAQQDGMHHLVHAMLDRHYCKEQRDGEECIV
jgi:hypothetical protein